jgi:hypothetical protein
MVVGIYFEWNGTMSLLIVVSFCILVSYNNELVSQFQKHLQNVPFPCFCGDKEDLLHVTHCIISLLPYEKIHLYQGYFNLLCH